MNSTIPGAAVYLDAATMSMPSLVATSSSSLSSLAHLVARFRPELELLWVLLSYAPFLGMTARFTSPKFARARSYPYPPLVLHIATGPLLVLRYHARYAAQRAWPRPDAADALLFAAFSLSSLLLQARRSRTPYSTPAIRAGFQASVLLQAALFGLAVLPRGVGGGGGDPALFRAAVKYTNWFASFRATYGLLGVVDPRLAGVRSFAQRFEVATVVSGCFAVWEAGVPAGVPVFLGLVAGLIVMERAVAETVSR